MTKKCKTAPAHVADFPDQAHLRPAAERAAAGKARRERCPRKSQGVWQAPSQRGDPIDLLIKQT